MPRLAASFARRLAGSIFALVGVSIVIFSIARLIPGDPARIALGPMASAEQVANLRAELRLDEPIFVQYGAYMSGLFRGDLGVSLYTGRPVATDLAAYLPATLELVIVAGLLMVLIGVPLGVWAGRTRRRSTDAVLRVIALLGVVTPSFVWAVALMLVFSYAFDLLPVAGRLTEGVAAPPRITGFYILDAAFAGQWRTMLDAISHIILPALALTAAGIGQAARLTRANIQEVGRSPYIEMARAFNYSEREIAFKYALRPALIPTMTILGLDFAALLGNAFLVEAVFAWPGVARYGVEAILHKDLNAIVGTVLVISLMFVITNIVVDVLVSWINPRIRLGEAGR